MQITVVRGPARGRTYLLGGKPVVLGRDDVADVRLDDPRVSRRHAEFRPLDASSWILRDLGSTNHTFLNGKRIESARIREGDEIVLGDTHLTVQGTVVAGDDGSVISMRVDPESLRRNLSEGHECSAGGKRLQEALFQIGHLADPALRREQILRSSIPVIEEGVPFSTWGWIRWPDGLEQPFLGFGERNGMPVDEASLDPSETLIHRSIRGRRAVISSEMSSELENSICLRRDGAVSALAVPLSCRGEDDSLLYFERDFRFPAFTAEELAWVAAVGSHLAGHLETSRLFHTLRGAHERLRASQEQLNHCEKMALVGNLASGFAHDLNNPLTSLLGFLELGRRQVEQLGLEGKIVEYMDRAHNAGDYCRALCRNLLAFARQQPFGDGDMREIDVRETIEGTIDICRGIARGRGAEIEFDQPESVSLLGDPATLGQIVMNLVVNASDAVSANPSDRPGRVTVQAVPDGSGVQLEVRDNGPGIPPEIAAKIFEPLVTSKEGKRGTGLGLFVVHRIVEDSGGTIDVLSDPEVGTTIRVRLPERLARLSSEELDPVRVGELAVAEDPS